MRACTILLLVAVAIALGGAGDSKPALDGVRILIVTPKSDRDACAWVEEIVTENGATAAIVDWSAATVTKARKYDLVIVSGKGRGPGKDLVTGYDRPVLGVGVYGHHYFGKLRLKHGHPYS